jgi:hypothetical protein
MATLVRLCLASSIAGWMMPETSLAGSMSSPEQYNNRHAVCKAGADEQSMPRNARCTWTQSRSFGQWNPQRSSVLCCSKSGRPAPAAL